jgi:hypothetical protein
VQDVSERLEKEAHRLASVMYGAGAARTGCAFRSEPKTVTTVVCVHGDGHIDEGSAECP